MVCQEKIHCISLLHWSWIPIIASTATLLMLGLYDFIGLWVFSFIIFLGFGMTMFRHLPLPQIMSRGWYMYKNSNQFKIVIQEIWKVNIILVLIISDIFPQGVIFSTFFSIKEQTNAYLIVNMPISLSGDVNIIDDSCTTQPVDT